MPHRIYVLICFFFLLFQVGRFSWPRSSGNGSSRRQIQLNMFAKFAEYLLSNLLLHFSTSTSPFSTQVLRNLPQISTKMTCVFFPNLLYSLPQSLTLKNLSTVVYYSTTSGV